jgi:hypothetical protein
MALTPEPALFNLLRQRRTPADTSSSEDDDSPSPPSNRVNDPDWRVVCQARARQAVEHGTPVRRRTRRRLQGNLLRNNNFEPLEEEEED